MYGTNCVVVIDLSPSAPHIVQQYAARSRLVAPKAPIGSLIVPMRVGAAEQFLTIVIAKMGDLPEPGKWNLY